MLLISAVPQDVTRPFWENHGHLKPESNINTTYRCQMYHLLENFESIDSTNYTLHKQARHKTHRWGWVEEVEKVEKKDEVATQIFQKLNNRPVVIPTDRKQGHGGGQELRPGDFMISRLLNRRLYILFIQASIKVCRWHILTSKLIYKESVVSRWLFLEWSRMCSKYPTDFPLFSVSFKLTTLLKSRHYSYAKFTPDQRCTTLECSVLFCTQKGRRGKHKDIFRISKE